MTYGQLPSPLASAIWPVATGHGMGGGLPADPLLYQGGIDAYTLLLNRPPDAFDVLVLCANELQFDGKPGGGIWVGGPAVEDTSVAYFARVGGTVLRCPMDDYKWPLGHAGQRQWRAVWKAAGQVAHAVQAGQRVLVTCAEGRNRSGLVNAVALHLLTGWDGEACIKHIQSRRPRALDNPWFCGRIRALEAAP